MIHIITKNTYLRIGLIHFLKENNYCVDTSESDSTSLEKELLPGDIVIYHVGKTDHHWVPRFLSISYKARVILLTSSTHLNVSAINNVTAIIGEKSPLRLILSSINNNHSYNVSARQCNINLTVREHYILVETFRNTPPYAIARLLDISVKTVYTHRKNSYRKLGARTIHDIFQLKEYLL